MNKEYMNMAYEYAKKSIDPSTKVGCVIVKDNVILSTGYNTLPKGLDITKYPLNSRNGTFLETKYPFMIHSEAKAIVDAKCCLNDAIMYVTLFPCNECAKLIIEAGIKTIYYAEDKYFDTDSVIASKMMLDDANIKYKYFSL